MLGYENSADERSPLKKLSPDSGQQVTKVALVQWGVLVDDIRITRTLLSQGYNHDDIRRLQARQELVRVRRGAWASPEVAPLGIEERHRRLVRATAFQLQDGAVFSHGSAAILHGLPARGGREGSRNW